MSMKPAFAEQAARAGMWSAVDILLRQGIQFAVTVTLARLLLPEDFGVMGLVALFTGISLLIVEGGTSLALIRAATTTRAEESAVFWFNLGASLLYGLLLLILAPLLARFYGIPLLVPLMAVTAAQCAIAALGSVPSAILSRALRFKTLLYVGLTTSVISGGVGIALAASGFGVWALSLQGLSAALTTTIALWVVSDWRPSLRVDVRGARDLFRFGSRTFLGFTLDLLWTHGVALVIGKLYGVRDVAFYNRAQATQIMPSGIMSAIIGRIGLPLLASRAHDPAAMQRGVKRALGLAMALNVPLMLGLSLLSDLIVLTLYGAKWLPAAPILSIVAIGGILWPIVMMNQQALLARNEADTFLRITVAKLGVGILAFAMGSLFGIVGLAYGQVGYSLAAMFLTAAPSRRLMAYGGWAQLKDLGGIFGISLGMGGAVLAGKHFLEASPAVELLLLTAAGAAFRIEGSLEVLRLGRSYLPSSKYPL
jgi:O-antigen/teichoic acid export membrane protein